MKKPFLILVFFLLLLTKIASGQTTSIYMKTGVSLPAIGDVALPTLGIGTRVEGERLGYDLSANLSSLVLFNDASLKGLLLIYPKHKNGFYFGVGPGFSYRADMIPMGGPIYSNTPEYGQFRLEGVVGYQKNTKRQCKPFFQIEPSQPIVTFGNQPNYKPGLSLTVGIGF